MDSNQVSGTAPLEPDRALLERDVDGGTAQRVPLSVHGAPAAGGARLSRHVKQGAFVVVGVIVGGIVIGIATTSTKAVDGNSARSEMVGLTTPDFNAMHMRPARPSSAASMAVRPLALAAHAASSPLAQQAAPAVSAAEKYRQWLEEQRYKELEGDVLAHESALVAKPVAAEHGGAIGTGLSAVKSVAQGNSIRAAAQPSADDGSADARQAMAALLGRQGARDGAPGGQDANKAFLAEAAKSSSGYLDAAELPAAGAHEVFAGSVIPAVMLTAINSDLPGTITAQVRQTVYDSLHADVVLIPQGTRLVGRYSSDVAYGQSRVLVAWSRLIFPTGATIDLQGMEGTDGQGRAGFEDQVDNHYLRIFGSAVLMSLLGVGAQLSQPQNSNALTAPGVGQQAAAAVAQQVDSVGSNLLNRNLNIQPTLEIGPGYAFNVVVNRTMILPPYAGGGGLR